MRISRSEGFGKIPLACPSHSNAGKKLYKIWQSLWRTAKFLLVGMVVGIGPYEAKAGSRNILESVGISVIAGSVLGASTMPFYRQPMQHKANIAWGAAAGFAVGLGIWGVAILGGKDSQANTAIQRLDVVETGEDAQHPLWSAPVAEIEFPILSLHW